MENSLPVEITDKAWEEIKEIVDKKNIPSGYGLRIGIKGQGCAGVSYLLGFDEPSDKDMLYHKDNLNVIIGKKDMMYVLGLKLDFYNESDGRGFTFLKD